jgi:hypothetical protein
MARLAQRVGILAYVIRKAIHRDGGYVASLPRFGMGEISVAKNRWR